TWMHRVRDAGHEMVSIGKLHFRSGEDDNGFSEEILPMHVVGGVGWMAALLREDPPAYDAAAELAADSGPGSSSYTDYDLAITAAATDWIAARRNAERPWAAFVSLVSPHFPLRAPPEFYNLYADADFDLEPQQLPDHPEIRNLARFFDYERHFTAETRHAAMAGYFGLTSFLDDCVGEILATLEESGQAEDTVILYLSDHGELLGDKGMWTKQVMYEASAGIPMILAGPGVPDGILRNTAASIVDVAATALDVMLDTSDDSSPGLSLRRLAQDPDDADRTVLCEYHDGGSTTGAFMVRWGDWKYVCYPGMPPQLFNLAEDPSEDHDLGSDVSQRAAAARAEGAARLAAICDADAVNRQCFADQAARIEALGGIDVCRNAHLFNHTPTPAEQAAMREDGR
ncbi:MAG: sulfatase-like hydrolase/transferase, partial [Pseudomonadota bacterium]|nr:sulfatase-like hydrolase/transferase [Pseudomonadota bacterium]